MHSRLCMFSREKPKIRIKKYSLLIETILKKASVASLMQLVTDGVDYPSSCLSFSLRCPAGNPVNLVWSPLVLAAFHLDKEHILFLLKAFPQHYTEAAQTFIALRRHAEQGGVLFSPTNTLQKYSLSDISTAFDKLHYLHTALSLESIQYIERCCSIYRVNLKSDLFRKEDGENKRTCQLNFYFSNSSKPYSETQIYLLEAIQKRIITLAENPETSHALKSCEESIQTDVFASQHTAHGVATIYRETILTRLLTLQATPIFATTSDAYNPFINYLG